LAEHRSVRSNRHLPELTVQQILRWADAQYERTGQWPRMESGAVVGVAGATWSAIQQALYIGCRGLPGGTSLARLLAGARGAPYRKRSREKLTVNLVLSWARLHRRRTGSWPTENSGPIPESTGDTWHAVDAALRKGSRGLRGGSSVFRLIEQYRR
jgi:hypothetical protein